MAFRVRVLHFIILGLFGMSLVIYSSYFTSPGQFSTQNDAVVGILASSPEQPAPSPIAEHIPDRLPNNTSLLAGQLRSEAIPPSALPSKAVSLVGKEVSTHINISPSTSSPSTPIAIPHARLVSMAVVVSERTSVDTKSVVFHVQKIPPKPGSPTASVVKSTHAQDSTEKGVPTRSIYQSGYEIPNLELCPQLGEHLQVMVLITSAPSHKGARMAIRQTWGHFGQRADVSVAFFLGTTPDVKLHQAITDESALYGDLIYANFVDTYNNLTLKTISMLEWVDLYCNRAKFILKTDDDMFINLPVLLNFIAKHSNQPRTIFGRLAKKWKPIRVKKSKYYVSPQQYHPAVFPNFTTGPAYLITGDAVHDLYGAALNKTYLKLEDVYVTGIVAQDVKVKRVHVNEFFNKRITFNPCSIQKGISIHMIKFHEQFDLWKKLLDGRSKCP